MNTTTKQRYNTPYAWAIVVMSSLFLFYKYMVQVSPSVMTNDLMRQFHLDATGLGNLASCYFYTYLVVQFLAGPLLDRFSPKYVSALALLLMSGSVFGFAHSTSLTSALLFRGLMGVGAAFATVSYLKLAAMWFSDKQYSLVAGLLATAAGVGSMMGQAPLAYSVAHSSWQHTLILCSIVGTVIAVLYALVVKDKPRSNHHDTSRKHLSFDDVKKLLKTPKIWTLTFYSGFSLGTNGRFWRTLGRSILTNHVSC